MEELSRGEAIAMGIPVYHDPRLPCPEYRHYSQRVSTPTRLAYGCPRCDTGWDYSHLTDNIYDALLFLQDEFKKIGEGQGETDVVIEPLL